jgi:cyclic pyranopterin phosphate synthase
MLSQLATKVLRVAGPVGKSRSLIIRKKSSFTHVDENNMPHMVDVGNKNVTRRVARARALVDLPNVIVEQFDKQKKEIQSKKGPVFATAIIAGTMAAKNTSQMIPFCHQIPLEGCDIDISLQENTAVIDSQVTCSNKTGVEMEALNACSLAALTIYDMCKALSHDIVIRDIRLIEKTGGKSDLKLKPDLAK